MDTNAGKFLHKVCFSEKSVFIFGNEEMGSKIPKELSKSVKRIKIKQFGKTKSLNFRAAASMAL
jgi:tRNA G18 (ribose-2'-O)-methylase SpoU